MSVKLLRDINGTAVEIFSIDATPSHEIVLNSAITEHPVEGGATITDNIRKEPDEITVTGFVSNYPLRVGLGLVPFRDDSRGRTALTALEEIRDNKERIQIQDNLKIWQSLAMRTLNIPRNQNTHNGLQFTASFRQIRIVGALLVELEDTADVLAEASPASDLGKQTPTEAPDEVDEGASTLLRILKYGGRVE